MMHFIAFLQAAKNRNGVFHSRFRDQHGLEAAFERGILFDMFFVLVERGSANGAQFAAGQRRLEHVGSIHCSFGRTGANQGMQLIDKKNDLPFGFGDFFENRLQTVFKFAAEFRSCHECGKVQGHNALCFEHVRHVSGNNALGEAFDDGRLADARFANQYGVVFCAPR